ncbi:tetratricopeptide repeat protein [Desulfonatronovibrio magnus]|uniref:tetratricopeptide repeat protein n=1 Tax=Desulfonatronovibrio magnus TaxID=698827 RepID=UPI0005EBDC79|nr:tetratricopeptide repeat protein [Desulfonatronovibrio magnus]
MSTFQKSTSKLGKSGHLFLSVVLGLFALFCWQSAAQARDEQATIPQAAFNALNEARELVGEQKWEDADKILLQVIDRFSNDPHTLVSAWQMRGYLLSESDRHQEALNAFDNALGCDEIDKSIRSWLLYNSAQILIILEQYDEALKRISKWTDMAGELTPDEHAGVAWIHYQAGSYQQAVKHMKAAIQNADKPRDSWMEMLVAAMHNADDYAGLLKWLPVLLERHPDERRYWEHLAGVHMHMGNDHKAAAVLSAGYQSGVFDSSDDIVRLVQLYRQAGVPRKGALILQQALEDGKIPDRPGYYQILADAWHQASELRLAANAMQEKLTRQNNCQCRLRLGRLFMQIEDWDEASEHLRLATESQCPKARRDALFLLGISQYHQGRLDSAREAFRQAENDPELRSRARYWIEILDRG